MGGVGELNVPSLKQSAGAKGGFTGALDGQWCPFLVDVPRQFFFRG